MGIRIDPTPPQQKWGKALRPLIDAISKAIGQNYLDAGFRLHDAIKAARVSEETLEQRAWTLWRESLSLAFGEFFKTAALTRQPSDAEELERLLAYILHGSAALVSKEQTELKAHDLKKPVDFSLYQDIRDTVSDWATRVAPEHLRAKEYLQRRLDRAFVKGFHRARFEGGEHFIPIKEYLAGDGAESIERSDLWLRYYEWLRAEVEDQPLFGQADVGPTLADIFVPLRCTWQDQTAASQTDHEGKSEQRFTAHIRWLSETLTDWLKKSDRADAMRIVSGGPGCGKSSSAKMFSRDVAFDDHFNVFVVPLQGLDVRATIPDIVASYVGAASLSGTSLPESPVSWLSTESKPLLLVFDGLDEIARPDGAGFEVTRQFLGNLRTWLATVNGATQDKAKVMTVVLGRPQAALEAAGEIGGLGDRAILRVAPLCPLSPDLFSDGQDTLPDFDDPNALATEDQREAFWQRYAQFDQELANDRPAALTEDTFADLTIEPLLLYLLMYSGYAGADWNEAKENRNRVYERIFQQVHERDLGKPASHHSKMGLEDEEDFFRLMECLGLAAWLGGGRTGTEGDFIRIRDAAYMPERIEDFEGLQGAGLRNVAVQFFTHHAADDQPGYGFVHKSFGEYLCARALIAAGEKWLRRYDGLAGDFAKAWLQLASQQAVTPEILRFMIDEARLRVKRSNADVPDVDTARRNVQGLVKVASATLRDGFPAHGPLEAMQAPSRWRGRERLQRHAEESLYAAIHSWAEVAYPLSSLNVDEPFGWKPGPISVSWANGLIARRLHGRLGGWPASGIGYRLLNRWNFSGQQLSGVQLIEAGLQGADLSRASLHLACLYKADLQGADLSGADLTQANLQQADLEGANLRSAVLKEANLKGANLQGASLEQADMLSANLKGTLLNGADLSKATSISQNQINASQGNLSTKLPASLTHPLHWKNDSGQSMAGS